MREAENIREVEQLKVDMIGFIFYPKSPRCLYELPAYMPVKAKRVGVFVNEDKKEIEIFADRFSLDYIQLHGNESPEDFENIGTYEESCDYFLFDTKCEQHGGSGNQFDWSMLNSYKGKKPFLLSGGINPYSPPTLKELRHPQLAGFDLNSRFETKPGLKDVERLRHFLEELRK